jgi:hypothetical protein
MTYLYDMYPVVCHGITNGTVYTTLLYTNVNKDKSILMHYHLFIVPRSKQNRNANNTTTTTQIPSHTQNIQALKSLLTRTKPVENDARQENRRAPLTRRNK